MEYVVAPSKTIFSELLEATTLLELAGATELLEATELLDATGVSPISGHL
jgi:hypothetical protein